MPALAQGRAGRDSFEEQSGDRQPPPDVKPGSQDQVRRAERAHNGNRDPPARGLHVEVVIEIPFPQQQPVREPDAAANRDCGQQIDHRLPETQAQQRRQVLDVLPQNAADRDLRSADGVENDHQHGRLLGEPEREDEPDTEQDEENAGQ